MKRLVLLLAFFLLLWDAAAFAEGVRTGINLCLETVVPSLWVFFVLSGLLSNAFAGWQPPRWCQRLCRRLWGLPGAALPVCLLGWLGGYPIGAKLTATLATQNHLSRRQTLTLLTLSVSGSPSFLVAGWSLVLFQNPLPGLLLWLSGVAACCITAALFAGRSAPKEMPPPPVQTAGLPAILRQSLGQMGMVCGYVLLFMGAGALLAQLPLPQEAKVLTSLTLELTAGSQQCILLPWPWSYLAVAAAASFGGLSVQGQIFSLLQGVSVSKPAWWLRRGVHLVLTVGLSALGLPLLTTAVSCFRSGDTLAIPTHAPVTTPLLLWMATLTVLLALRFEQLPERKGGRAQGHSRRTAKSSNGTRI